MISIFSRMIISLTIPISIFFNCSFYIQHFPINLLIDIVKNPYQYFVDSDILTICVDMLSIFQKCWCIDSQYRYFIKHAWKTQNLVKNWICYQNVDKCWSKEEEFPNDQDLLPDQKSWSSWQFEGQPWVGEVRQMHALRRRRNRVYKLPFLS